MLFRQAQYKTLCLQGFRSASVRERWLRKNDVIERKRRSPAPIFSDKRKSWFKKILTKSWRAPVNYGLLKVAWRVLMSVAYLEREFRKWANVANFYDFIRAIRQVAPFALKSFWLWESHALSGGYYLDNW